MLTVYQRCCTLAIIACWIVGAAFALQVPMDVESDAASDSASTANRSQVNPLIGGVPSEQADATEALSLTETISLAGAIWLNNLGVVLILVVGGLLSGGVIAVAGSVWNGFLLGVIVHLGVESGLTTTDIAWALLVHGPAELTALVWAGAIGLGGARIAGELWSTGRLSGHHIPPASHVAWIIGLLFVAAALEGIVIVL